MWISITGYRFYKIKNRKRTKTMGTSSDRIICTHIVRVQHVPAIYMYVGKRDMLHTVLSAHG